MSNFDLNAIIRGAWLTVVGALRALRNPALFTSKHYQHAALAVCVGIAIQLIISIPLLFIKLLLKLCGLVVNLEDSTWDETIVSSLDFVANSVLQIPFFLMTLMRHVSPTMDQMFMDSLAWVDQTYVSKHANDDPASLRQLYHPSMSSYKADARSPRSKTGEKLSPKQALLATSRTFVMRFAKKAAISLAVYFASFLPIVGRFVLPAASFYTFRKAVGNAPAIVIFGTGIFLPRYYLVQFLQSYFASRSLMRELLQPYFSRIPYSRQQKKQWFRDREGVLFGFGIGFYTMVKTPLLGVLIYGIAEASTAYLITKVTSPPPESSNKEMVQQFLESDVTWKNKHEFLTMPVLDMDKADVDDKEQEGRIQSMPGYYAKELAGQKFT